MSVVDDYGRYDGRPSVMRASLYPLKLDNVSEPDVAKWLAECAEAVLVRGYVVSGKRFVELLDFNQRVRTASKWPPPDRPDSNLPHSAADCSKVDTSPNTHSHSNSEGKGGMGEKPRNLTPQMQAEIGKHFNRGPQDRWSYEEEHLLADVCRRPATESEWLEILQFRRVAAKQGDKMRETVKSLLENWQGELDRARKLVKQPNRQAPRSANDLLTSAPESKPVDQAFMDKCKRDAGLI